MKKRKATELIEVTTKKKFVFNKRGKLKDDELKELARTNKNIFSWLKPTPAPVLKLAKVMGVEHTEEMEDMDVRDERLERVRLRQLEWACQMICKGLVMEMVDTAVLVSERTVCESWINTTLINKCWNTLKCGRLMKEGMT